jgi:hypothetical protein
VGGWAAALTAIAFSESQKKRTILESLRERQYLASRQIENRREPQHRRKPEYDNAWPARNAEGEDLPEIKIKGYDDAMVRGGILDEFAVGCPFKSQRPEMDCIVT